jgi:hypothetical protein
VSLCGGRLRSIFIYTLIRWNEDTLHEEDTKLHAIRRLHATHCFRTTRARIAQLSGQKYYIQSSLSFQSDQIVIIIINYDFTHHVDNSGACNKTRTSTPSVVAMVELLRHGHHYVTETKKHCQDPCRRPLLSHPWLATPDGHVGYTTYLFSTDPYERSLLLSCTQTKQTEQPIVRLVRSSIVLHGSEWSTRTSLACQ